METKLELLFNPESEKDMKPCKLADNMYIKLDRERQRMKQESYTHETADYKPSPPGQKPTIFRQVRK